MPKSCRQTRHAGPLETVSVDVLSGRGGRRRSSRGLLFARAHATPSACFVKSRHPERVACRGRCERRMQAMEELEAALLLASELSESEVPGAARCDRPGRLAKARSYAFVPRTTDRSTLRGTRNASPQPASLGKDHPHARCRPCLWIRGTRLDPRMHPRARGCGAASASRILDLGTGSGILAMAAASLLRRAVLATDVEPWSIWVAQRNVTLNRLGRLVTVRLADGWQHAAARRHRPYDLVFANILARPLCQMARKLALHRLPGGTAILSGLLARQVRSSHGASALWPQAGGNHAGRALGDAAYASTCRRSQQPM